MFVQNAALTFQQHGKGRYISYIVKGAWGVDNMANVSIKSVVDSKTGKFLRSYVTLPIGTAKIMTKNNGFPKSIFFATRSTQPDVICGTLLEGKQIQDIIVIDNSTSSPKQIPTDACQSILSTYLNAYLEIAARYRNGILQHLKRNTN